MTKRTAAVLLNAAAALLTAYAVGSFFFRVGDGNMQVARFACFIYFTVDSNVLAAACAVVSAVYLLKGGTPAWATKLKLAGTAAVGLTFMTVMVYLGPAFGYPAMFEGNNLYLHLICPVLLMASFTLLEKENALGRGTALLGALPALVYGLVYLVLVVAVGPRNGGWYDFYGFNTGGYWYVIFPAMMLFALAIAAALRRGHNAGVKSAKTGE